MLPQRAAQRTGNRLGSTKNSRVVQERIILWHGTFWRILSSKAPSLFDNTSWIAVLDYRDTAGVVTLHGIVCGNRHRA